MKYEASALPFAADMCHCRDCQLATGAPFGAWMDFSASQVRWLMASPTEYVSSETIRRGFCPQCGSTLSYRSTEHPEYVTLSIASLDDPDAVAPTYHIHTASQLKWLCIADERKRYSAGRCDV